MSPKRSLQFLLLYFVINQKTSSGKIQITPCHVSTNTLFLLEMILLNFIKINQLTQFN